jgi:hypothetical protein
LYLKYADFISFCIIPKALTAAQGIQNDKNPKNPNPRRARVSNPPAWTNGEPKRERVKNKTTNDNVKQTTKANCVKKRQKAKRPSHRA